MNCFYNIIVYYLDEDLSQLFVSATPIQLLANVKAIADDDTAINTAFYQNLQVPFLSSFLAYNTLSDMAHVNVVRACGKRAVV